MNTRHFPPRRRYLPLFAAVLLLPTMAWGLGADHPTTPIRHDRWPKGLAELVNRPERVHGYFVNQVDIFFFRGDAALLNDFLTHYGKLPNTALRVVLHDGKPEVKSPWDEQPRTIDADWRIYAAPHEEGGVLPKAGEFVTRLDVWLGGSIKRGELRMPANVSVESARPATLTSTAPASRPAPAPATQPTGKHRLTRQTVAGLGPMQWVFIVVTPEGYPWVATPEQLRPMIEKAVPANATLEWVSGCKRVGGEPLETAEELGALKAFCAARGVTFTHRAGF